MPDPATPSDFDDRADGWRFTATFAHWITGADRTYQKYTYGGEIEQHGYQAAGGGWGLHDLGGEVKSHRVKAKRYRAQDWRWLVLDNVIAIEEGWRDVKSS